MLMLITENKREIMVIFFVNFILKQQLFNLNILSHGLSKYHTNCFLFLVIEHDILLGDRL